MYFSTGEISVLQRLQADGKEVHAGQLLRLIDIPINGGTILATDCGSSAEHADKLKAACARHFGVAGPGLVRALVSEYEDARALTATVKTMLAHYVAALTPVSAQAEQRRAVKRFALLMVVGELATKLGVLSECTMDDIERAVRIALRAWQADGSNIPDRLRGVLNVQAFIERNESRFQNLQTTSDQIPRDRVGFVGWDKVIGRTCFWFTNNGFTEACGGQDARETAQELFARGYLIARERGRFTEKREFGDERRRVYIVLSSLLAFDHRDSDGSGAAGAGGAATLDEGAAVR